MSADIWNPFQNKMHGAWVPLRTQMSYGGLPNLLCLLSCLPRLLWGWWSPERGGHPGAWICRGPRLPGWREWVPSSRQPEQLTKPLPSFRAGKVDKNTPQFETLWHAHPSTCTPAGLGSNLTTLFPGVSVFCIPLTFCKECWKKKKRVEGLLLKITFRTHEALFDHASHYLHINSVKTSYFVKCWQCTATNPDDTGT